MNAWRFLTKLHIRLVLSRPGIGGAHKMAYSRSRLLTNTCVNSTSWQCTTLSVSYQIV